MYLTAKWVMPSFAQPTNGGAVLADCCANCVENIRPQQWVPDLPFLDMPTRTMAGTAPHKSRRCQNKSMSNNHTQTSLICDICHKEIHGRNQISIRCNRIEYWVHLKCAYIHIARYTGT